MTEADEVFARRAVRRKRLFLVLSMAGLAISAFLIVLYSYFWYSRPDYPIAPRAVIVLLVLLNARQNLRQYKYAGLLEQMLPPRAAR